jgi:hypothetical protein
MAGAVNPRCRYSAPFDERRSCLERNQGAQLDDGHCLVAGNFHITDHEARATRDGEGHDLHAVGLVAPMRSLGLPVALLEEEIPDATVGIFEQVLVHGAFSRDGDELVHAVARQRVAFEGELHHWPGTHLHHHIND